LREWDPFVKIREIRVSHPFGPAPYLQGIREEWPAKRRERTRKGEIGNIGRAVAYAIEQPADVNVNEIIVRPTAAPV
jgi:hypothetical protein